jgi:hypothetical protein
VVPANCSRGCHTSPGRCWRSFTDRIQLDATIWLRTGEQGRDQAWSSTSTCLTDSSPRRTNEVAGWDSAFRPDPTKNRRMVRSCGSRGEGGMMRRWAWGRKRSARRSLLSSGREAKSRTARGCPNDPRANLQVTDVHLRAADGPSGAVYVP